jgi:hypothetical protein
MAASPSYGKLVKAIRVLRDIGTKSDLKEQCELYYPLEERDSICFTRQDVGICNITMLVVQVLDTFPHTIQRISNGAHRRAYRETGLFIWCPHASLMSIARRRNRKPSNASPKH